LAANCYAPSNKPCYPQQDATACGVTNIKMSRIGKKPIPLPSAVKVSVAGNNVTVEAGSNRLSIAHRPEVTVHVDSDTNSVVVERQDDLRTSKAMHGLTRSLIANMVQGVTGGFTKELEIVGAGWNAQVKGTNVNLNIGYADTKVVNIPMGVTVEVTGPRIKVTGIDKQVVGQCAAEIRAKRPPEPYNGRGVKYVDEQIQRKQGKQFVGGEG
jgi:large subunit ribosomal protein L6